MGFVSKARIRLVAAGVATVFAGVWTWQVVRGSGGNPEIPVLLGIMAATFWFDWARRRREFASRRGS